MAEAFGIYEKANGSPEGPKQITVRLSGDFQSSDAAIGEARNTKAPDGYILYKVWFFGEHYLI